MASIFDGCLADFNHAYLDLLKKVSGLEFEVGQPEVWPEQWDWPELLAPTGITKDHERDAWKIIEAGDSWFWYGLSAYGGAKEAIQMADGLGQDGHNIYYITSRPGLCAKKHTEAWLRVVGGIGNPTVLISHKKGFTAAGLELDHMIDDKPENLYDVRKMMGLLCKGWMVRRPWNRKADMRYIEQVDSVLEALKKIEEGFDGA